MHFFKQYLQYYPETKVGIKEKCKNHKKLHQFCSKISVHLKTDSCNYTLFKENGTFTSGSHKAQHKRKEIQWLNTIQ